MNPGGNAPPLIEKVHIDPNARSLSEIPDPAASAVGHQRSRIYPSCTSGGSMRPIPANLAAAVEAAGPV
jgi:hypothetical protein